MTSRAAAVSATVRVRTPSTPRKFVPISGAIEMRSRWGLRPTSPQQAAGTRVDPPASLASAIGTMPLATALLDPTEGPPDVLNAYHELRAGPTRRVLNH